MSVTLRASLGAARPALNLGTYSPVLRVIGLVSICAIAYHYTLLTLATSSAYLALLPAMALLLGLQRAAAAESGPDIHDRYLDWIVGLPLLVAALAIMTILPIRLSAYFWLWRLDLVSLPIFVAAAIALTFGTRALWRLRLPIALLGVIWPAQHVLALTSGGAFPSYPINKLLSFASAMLPPAHIVGFPSGLATLMLTPAVAFVVFGLGTRQMAVRPLDLGLGAITPDLRERLSGWAAGLLGAVRPRRLAVQRAGTALAILSLAATVATLANDAQRQFQLVASPLGTPVLQSAVVPNNPLPGWSIRKTDSYAWAPVYLGRGGTWDRYRYSSQTSQNSAPSGLGLYGPVTLDLFTTADGSALARYSIEDSYRLHSYRLKTAQVIDLGGGVVAKSVVYQQQSTGATWAGVDWEWPVRTAAGLAYQRVVLNVRNRTDAEWRLAPPSTARLQPLRFTALQLFGGARTAAASDASSQAGDALAEFATQVAQASLGSSR